MEKAVAINALVALAHDTRLSIFRTLVTHNPSGLPAGKISEMLELPSATLTFHLKLLKQAGLIACVRHGRSLVYSAKTNTVDSLTQYLQEDCCLKGVIDDTE